MLSKTNPSDRQPKGDHNRRLAMGLSPEEFAEAAGVSVEELREYERTGPNHTFSTMVAAKVGDALERLEQRLPNSQAIGVNNPRVSADELAATISAAAEAATPEERVQAIAYDIWERDGRPHGRDQEYWFKALAIYENSKRTDVSTPDDLGGRFK